MHAQRSVGEGAKLRQPTAACDIPRLQCVMAARSAKTLPSDPEYLLSLMSQIGEDSEGDDDFDGWLDDHREHDDKTPPCRRSMSLEALDSTHPCNSVLSPLAHTFVSPPIIYHCPYHIMPQFTEAYYALLSVANAPFLLGLPPYLTYQCHMKAYQCHMKSLYLPLR